MKWFRSHIKQGSRLAIFALAIQFVLSFGHFHGIAAQAASSIQSGIPLTGALNDHTLNDQAPGDLRELAGQPSPANHDNDRQTGEGCAICAVIALANVALSATPPLLVPPQAVEFSYRLNEAAFIHLNAARPVFQPRAPPIS